MNEPFDYAEWVKSGSVKQPFEEYQMFACDWIAPGATHEEGFDACVQGIMSHEPHANHDEVLKAVRGWGHLGREDE